MWTIRVTIVFIVIWEVMVQEAAQNAIGAPDQLAKAHAANMEYDVLFKHQSNANQTAFAAIPGLICFADSSKSIITG